MSRRYDDDVGPLINMIAAGDLTFQAVANEMTKRLGRPISRQQTQKWLNTRHRHEPLYSAGVALVELTNDLRRNQSNAGVTKSPRRSRRSPSAVLNGGRST